MKRITLIFALLLLACTATVSAQKAAKASNVIELQANGTLPFGKGLPVVVDFSATWCGPCRYYEPIFHEVAQRYKGRVLFVHVDIDKCPNLAKKYSLNCVPTTMIFSSDGRALNTFSGVVETDELIDVINQTLFR